MTDLENLNFKIKEKEDELNHLTLTTFIIRIVQNAQESLLNLKRKEKRWRIISNE